jgi:hypothetical protein
MELRSRTRLQLRRAAMTAALGALLVPATAGAATKHTPTISKVAPKTTYVGEVLTIQGKYFTRGKGKNSVWFKRDRGKSLLVKAGVSTTRKLQIVVPKSLEKYMSIKAGQPAATRFRLRVLSTRLGKAFTSVSRSPLIGPERAKDGGAGNGTPTDDGDCDGDGIKNGVDTDDDADMLPDTLEVQLKLNQCSPDSDGDGVEDGYEYQSALDLNNDDYQEANKVVPYPGKRPYPNPLYADANVDYDGDGLSLAEEQALWRYTYQVNHTATRTLSPLSYSDGAQYSLSTLENGSGRRQPTMTVAAYTPPQSFRAWADLTGYGTPQIFAVDSTHVRGALDLFDADRDGVVTATPRAFDSPATGDQLRAERYYWNLDNDGFVSDDERDEDSDGLTNYDETHGRMTPDYWEGCYSSENPYPVGYPGTSAVDADSDGDGVLDGADDQDFDDVPNIMELSRNMAGNLPIQNSCFVGSAPALPRTPHKTYVNPFNPCLPDIDSRTCQRHPVLGQAYPPFDAEWKPHILN